MKARVLAVLTASAIAVVLLLLRRTPSAPERSPQDAAHSTPSAGSGDPAPPPPTAGTPAALPVRDLADGSPVSGFGVRVGERTIRTDDAGMLRLPPGEDGTLVPVDAAFVLVPSSVSDARTEGALWVRRTFHVVVRVSASGETPPDPARTWIETTWEEGAEPPWTSLWLSLHDIMPDQWSADTAAAYGTLEMDLPRIPGLRVQASTDGWRPASRTLTVDAGTDLVQVDLVLLPALRVRGVVSDEEGRALGGATVFVQVIHRGTSTRTGEDEDGDVEWVGRTTRRILDDGTEIVSCGGVTDQRGRFDLAIATEGEGSLQVRRVGFVPRERALGFVGADTDVEVALEPGRGTRVRFLRNGMPAKEATLYVSDLGMPDLPVFPLRTDKGGSAPAEWLVAGRRYAVLLDGVRGAREIAWSGQAVVDVAAMPEVPP